MEKIPVSGETGTTSPFRNLVLAGRGVTICATIPIDEVGFVCNLFPFPSPFVERAKGSGFDCLLATIVWLNGDLFRYLEKITIYETWTLRNLRT